MNCPYCNKAMMEGTLQLSAEGVGGFSPLPVLFNRFKAYLKFNRYLIEKDSYNEGTNIFKLFRPAKKGMTAFRCKECEFVSFKYDKYKYL